MFPLWWAPVSRLIVTRRWYNLTLGALWAYATNSFNPASWSSPPACVYVWMCRRRYRQTVLGCSTRTLRTLPERRKDYFLLRLQSTQQRATHSCDTYFATFHVFNRAWPAALVTPNLKTCVRLASHPASGRSLGRRCCSLFLYLFFFPFSCFSKQTQLSSKTRYSNTSRWPFTQGPWASPRPTPVYPSALRRIWSHCC